MNRVHEVPGTNGFRTCGQGEPPRLGFTLVELLVVIAIIGMISGIVTVRTSGVTRQAKLEWSIGRIIQLDGELRNISVRRGLRARLECELGTNRIHRIIGDADADRTLIEFGENVILSRLLLPAKQLTSGIGIIEYSSGGLSQTFAIEFRSPGDRKWSDWLIIAGSTGQFERQENERDVINTVRQSGAVRNDTR